MTDVELYQPPAAEVVLASDIDSWTQIAGQVIKLAKEIYDTPFVPDGLRGSIPAVSAAILAGRELGLPPLTSLANIHIIKGKPSLSAALMRALIMAQGHQIETVSVTDTRVVIRGRRRGEANWEEASFSADQAKQARIDIGGYPQDKLYARATSRLARRKFADVIAGMPYSAEDLEDGTEDGETPAVNGTAPPAAQPAQRTARRRQAAPQTASPAEPQSRAADAQTPPAPAAGEAPMPPLPGEEEADPTSRQAARSESPATGRNAQPATPTSMDEPDETDYDSPGTASGPQLTAIWTNFTTAFKFGNDEKEQARAVCAHIIGRPVTSTKDMSHNEARTVLDTLGNWREVAERNKTAPREFLIELMATAEQGAGDE